MQLTDENQIFDVLSVGIDQRLIPTKTILENGKPKCCQLPSELFEWASDVVCLEMRGTNLFPSKAAITYVNGKYFVDIL